jgi:hypothetical protein
MNIKYWNRGIWAMVYFLVGFGIIAILLYLQFTTTIVFCDEFTITEHLHFYRFLWCISFACFGFAAIAYYWYKQNKKLSSDKKLSPAWPGYVTRYPLQLLITACLVLGVLHFWKRTSGYTYYYLSGAICFVLGFMVDYHWRIVKSSLDIYKNRRK